MDRLPNRAKNRAQDRGRAADRITPNATFLVGYQEEKPVESFLGHVAVNVGSVLPYYPAQKAVPPHHLLVFLRHADLLSEPFNDRTELVAEPLFARPAEKFGRGVVLSTGKDLAGVVETHLPNGFEEHIDSDRDGLLSGVVHRLDEFVHAAPLPGGP